MGVNHFTQMIEILGLDNGSEYEAAKHLRKLILSAWPNVERNNGDRIWIIAGAKCYGQEVVDIDILLLVQLARHYTIPSTNPSATPVYISSLCVCIELKSHNPEGVRFVGNNVDVAYKSKWHNVSEQSYKQRFSVRNYLQQHTDMPPPFVLNLIWLSGVTEEELPTQIHNIMGSDATWKTFLHKIAINQKPRWNRNLNAKELRAFSTQRGGELRAIAEISTKQMQPTKLDRLRMERISKKVLSGQKYGDKFSSQLLIFRGRGGTGKTIRLLRLAYELYDERDDRILILTYNKALVADIRRLLDHMGVGRRIAQKGVNIQTVHSFIRQILLGVGIYKDSDSPFLENYDQYKVEALELMQPEDVNQLIKNNNEAFSWDLIFVDESQDWPTDERDILFSVYDFRQFVIADGIDQLVRSHRPN